MHTLSTGAAVGGVLPGRRSWGGSNEIYPPPPPSGGQLSQESVFNSLTSPPPLPPRPEESDSDEEDPDYAYIDENKVKGPENQRGRSRTISSGGGGVRGRMGSPTLDDQLEELKKSIMRENKKKKRDKAVAVRVERKAATLHFPPRTSPRSRLPRQFIQADPEDYLEPVSSKGPTSTSSEGVPSGNKLSLNVDGLSRSLSDHGGNANSSSSSIGTAMFEVFDDSQSPPDVHSGGGVGVGGNPPALPPRPWRNSSVASTSSISSATSPSSTSVPPLSVTPVNAAPTAGEDKNSVAIPEEEPQRSNAASRTLSSPQDAVSSPHGSEQTPTATAVVGDGGGVGSKHGSVSPTDMDSSTSSPPPLPPRSPTRDRERLSRKSSSSSVSSTASCSRCPRCRSLKKAKTSVGKTVSLDQRGIQRVQNLNRDESRKSLPDLNNTSPFPDNNLAQHQQHQAHCASREHNHGSSCSKCSTGSSADGLHGPTAAAASNSSLVSSSSQNLEYLQLLSEEGTKRESGVQQPDIDTDMSPALDLLSSCLQDLEYLENKVNRTTPPNTSSSSPNQLKSKSATTLSDQKRMAVQTDIDAAMKRTELVQADLKAATSRNVHPMTTAAATVAETKKPVANGHPPLLKKLNTVGTFSNLPSSASPSPVPANNTGPLHWTQQPQPQSHPQHSHHPNGTVVRHSSSSSSIASPSSVASPRSLQSPVSNFSPGFSNVATSGAGAAPPVPPRSLVSLGEAQPRAPPQPHGQMMSRSFSQMNTRAHTKQRPLSKANSVGRHMNTRKTFYGDPHAPQWNSPAAGTSPGMVGGPSPAGFHHQNHMDSQSATVFVHHLSRNGSGRHRQVRAHLV